MIDDPGSPKSILHWLRVCMFNLNVQRSSSLQVGHKPVRPFHLPSRNATVTKDDICMVCYLIALYLPSVTTYVSAYKDFGNIARKNEPPHSSILSVRATIPFCLIPCVEDRDVRKASVVWAAITVQYCCYQRDCGVQGPEGPKHYSWPCNSERLTIMAPRQRYHFLNPGRLS